MNHFLNSPIIQHRITIIGKNMTYGKHPYKFKKHLNKNRRSHTKTRRGRKKTKNLYATLEANNKRREIEERVINRKVIKDLWKLLADVVAHSKKT